MKGKTFMRQALLAALLLLFAAGTSLAAPMNAAVSEPSAREAGTVEAKKERPPQERQAQRHVVILLPLLVSSVPDSVAEEMKSRLAKEFHVPLNETLQAVTYADAEEMRRAADIIYRGKDSLADRILEAADATGADYIVGLVVTSYDERTYINWKDEQILHSYAALRLVGYDKARGLVVDIPASRSYNGEYTKSGTARILALFELNRVLEKAAFKESLFPLAKWLDKAEE